MNRFLLKNINKDYKNYEKRLAHIYELQDEYDKYMGDTEILYIHTLKLKNSPYKLNHRSAIMDESFVIFASACKKITGRYPHDNQFIAAMALADGKIAEMGTGEGKTLAIGMAAFFNYICNNRTIVVTPNEYLVNRDSNEIRSIVRGLPVEVGHIRHTDENFLKAVSYEYDIIYITNYELCFDYLRDNLETEANCMVQSKFNNIIIDEIDSILIDEARTPIIISKSINTNKINYYKARDLANSMNGTVIKEINNKEDYDETEYDYISDIKTHSIIITSNGYDKIYKEFKIKDELDPENAVYIGYVTQAIKAKTQLKKGKDYIVKDDKIVVVDEFTGRLMYGRVYTNGLHQAVEAKEGLDIRKDSEIQASISMQTYFNKFHICGTTGTAITEKNEFKDIYGLDIVKIEPNKPLIRIDHKDKIFRTKKQKYDAIIEQIKKCHSTGQPVLIGTVDIETSKIISNMLKEKGIEHNLLNAEHTEKEAMIVAQAGKLGAVTVATNMAGRGTDIILGGNLVYEIFDKIRNFDYSVLKEKYKLIGKGNQFNTDLNKIEDITEYEIDIDGKDILPKMEQNYIANKINDSLRPVVKELKEKYHNDKKKVIELGGLFIIGSERHESRRIDNQLIGRCGRQGDPGESQFFLSLEDKLLDVYGGNITSSVLNRLDTIYNIEKSSEIKIPAKLIDKAQKNIESINFQARKLLIQFDKIIDKQREEVYTQRIKVMAYKELDDTMQICNTMVRKYIENIWDSENSDVMQIIEGNIALTEVFESDDFKIDSNMSPKDSMVESIKAFIKNKINNMKTDKKTKYAIITKLIINTVDTYWKEQTYNLNELMTGIVLRAYGNYDIVQEFEKEAYNMYENMNRSIEKAIVEHLILMEYKFDKN